MLTCYHCRLQYQVAVEGQNPTTEYQAMDSILGTRDLQIKFENGEWMIIVHVLNEHRVIPKPA